MKNVTINVAAKIEWALQMNDANYPSEEEAKKTIIDGITKATHAETVEIDKIVINIKEAD